VINDPNAAADQQPKQNTLIPMQDPAGNRCFVNAWDVASRKADGWTVIGELAFHTSSTRAPSELLAGKGEPNKPPAAPLNVDDERARVRAIVRAADDDQTPLADKLIADGTAEADALKALAADKATRKPAKPAAPKPAAPAPAPAAN
jgi:hypothetical protein